MTVEILIVFALLVVVIGLFLSERLGPDLIALMAVAVLLLSGILTPKEAFAGFADSTVLIIAGLFVVGAGIFQTGVADALGQQLARFAKSSENRLISAIMAIVAFLSAFMSSTGTVAVFLPVAVSLARRTRISPAKLLIPLAYASLLGGMVTLIGTPPNIVVSTQLEAAGLPPFGFFAFTPVGLLMFAIGLAYVLLAGRRLLPDRAHEESSQARQTIAAAELAALYGLPNSLYRVQIAPDSPLVGKTLAEAHLRATYQINVVARAPQQVGATAPEQLPPVEPTTQLRAHDTLLLKGTAEAVAHVAQAQGLLMLPNAESETGVADLHSEELRLVEVVLTPRSRLIGKSLRAIRFRDTYNITVLAILRVGRTLDVPTSQVELRFGDTLLVQGAATQISALLAERDDFVVIGQSAQASGVRYDTRRAPIAVAIMLAMLIAVTVEIVPMVTAVLLAAIAMLLTKCVAMKEVYRTINWESIVLIAGMLPMATALDKTGGMQLIVNLLTSSLGELGPLAMLAGLFALTSLFSQFISNTATTVLMAPIAIQAAAGLGVSPHAMLMGVAIAASTSFSTPIASPVNTLVFGPGGYTFSDFVKIGVPLQIMIMLASLLILPLLFPW